MLAGMPDAKANGALGAASAGLEAQTAEAGQGLRHRVWFHHRKKPQALYCVDNNYWWYYRPYNTKGGQPVSEAYARCMPYFHYTEEAYGGAPQGPVK
ncbi:hypothetical protein HT051_07715 [Methyloligella sp. GL2]|nr:hypothetical protein HT051_07715 [Methyloligella sp. GL2]